MRKNRILFYALIFLSQCFVHSKEVTISTTNHLKVECIIEKNKDSCITLIKNGLPNIRQCNTNVDCILIGIVYLNADRINEAIPYLNKIQDSNAANQHNNIGLFYKNNKDYSNAKKEFEQGCAKKYMQSCFNLGGLYENGLGVKKDYNIALNLYIQSCNNKIAEGCYNAGIIYLNGNATKKDLKSAQLYLNQGCNMEHKDSCELNNKLNNKSNKELKQ